MIIKGEAPVGPSKQYPIYKQKHVKETPLPPQRVKTRDLFKFLNIWDCDKAKKQKYLNEFERFEKRKKEHLKMSEIEKTLKQPDFRVFWKYLKDNPPDELNTDNIEIEFNYTASSRRKANSRTVSIPYVREQVFEKHHTELNLDVSPEDVLIVRQMFKRAIEFENQTRVSKQLLYTLMSKNQAFTKAYDINNTTLDDSSHEDLITVDEFVNCILYPKILIIKQNDKDPQKPKPKIVFRQEQLHQLKNVFDRLDIDGTGVDSTQFANCLRKEHEIQKLLFQPLLQAGNYNISLEKWLYSYQIFAQGKTTWDEFTSNFRILDIPHKGVVIHTTQLLKDDEQTLLSLKFFADLYNIYKRLGQWFIESKRIVDEIKADDDFMVKNAKRLVRRDQTNHLPIETVSATLDRIIKESELLDFDDLVDFFTIRGRPLILSEKFKSIIQPERPIPKPKDVIIEHQYLVTIPNEVRERYQGKTIRENAVEQMVKQKEAALQRELQYKFKANKVPKYVTDKRLQEIEDAKERNRQRLIEESLAAQCHHELKHYELQQIRPGPPEESDHRFYANPIPSTTRDPLYEQFCQERKMRSQMNVQQRRAYWEQYFANHPDQTEQRILEMSMRRKSRGTPEREYKYRARNMPDFEYLHSKFEDELLQKKKQFQPTIPLENSLSIHNRLEEDRRYLDYENYLRSNSQGRIRDIDQRLERILKHPKPTIINTIQSRSIPTLRRKQRYEKFAQQQAQEQEWKSLKEERKSLLPKNIVISNPAATGQHILDQELNDLVKWKRKYHKNLDNDYEQDLQKMAEKVRNKPLMMYSTDIE